MHSVREVNILNMPQNWINKKGMMQQMQQRIQCNNEHLEGPTCYYDQPGEIKTHVNSYMLINHIIAAELNDNSESQRVALTIVQWEWEMKGKVKIAAELQERNLP